MTPTRDCAALDSALSSGNLSEVFRIQDELSTEEWIPMFIAIKQYTIFYKEVEGLITILNEDADRILLCRSRMAALEASPTLYEAALIAAIALAVLLSILFWFIL